MNIIAGPSPDVITPYTGTFGKKELLHLLRRTLFGVSVADLKAFENKSLSQVVDALIAFPATVPDPPIRSYQGRALTEFDPLVPYGETWVNTKPGQVQNSPEPARRTNYKQWWIQLMALQERNLREKLVLFWHNHLVTDTNETVSIGILAYRYNTLLRKYCIGNFKDFVHDMTLEPAMLNYLNGEKSTVAAPDENFSRELQELFCLGKGPDSKYTEDDVKAAARLLTGWNVSYGDNYQAVFRQNRHDTKDKQFSSFYGNKLIKGKNSATAGNEELIELMDMIFATNEVAKFIVRKLFTFFVYYEITAETESNLIVPLADLFRSGNYEIKPVLKALLTSEWFFKKEYRGAVIKSPADYTIGMTRQMAIAWPTETKAFEARYFFANQLLQAMNNQGQEIGDPPNVAGWPAYYQTPSFHELWVDTATYPPRLTLIDTLGVKGIATGNSANFINSESKQKTFKIDFVAFVKTLSKPADPNILINDLVDLFYGPTVSDSVKNSLKTTYLLKGQASDHYWTDAYSEYDFNPNTTVAEAKLVPKQLTDLINYMFTAAEYHLH